MMQPPTRRRTRPPFSFTRFVENKNRHDCAASRHRRVQRRIILQPQILPKPNERGIHEETTLSPRLKTRLQFRI
jgi:hypothetical protein